MKIGLIFSILQNGGGAYQVVHLARELQNKGHLVTLYTLDDRLSEKNPELVKGLTIKSVHFTEPVETRPHGQFVGYYLYLAHLIKSVYYLANIVEQDELSVLNPHEWPASLAAIIVKWKKHIPIVWMCNDVWHTQKDSRIVFRIGNVFASFLDYFLTKSIDAITVLDHRIARIIKEHYHSSAVVVRSGIDLEKFQRMQPKVVSRKVLNLPESPILFLCFSIFFPHRRFEDAIEAFAALKKKNPKKDLRLIIAGSQEYDPAYAQKIKRLVQEANLEDSVTIDTAYKTPSEVITYLTAADVFIFPNEQQTWGLIVAEAMAAGTPCIVSNEAGVHEIITNGENGYTFPVHKSSLLMERMEELLNEKLRVKIGKNAREYVFAHLSWENYAKQMLQVFTDVARI